MAQGGLDRAFDRLMGDLAGLPAGDRARVPARLWTFCGEPGAPTALRALVAAHAHLLSRGGAADLLQLAASQGAGSPLTEAALRWAERRWRAPLLVRLGASAELDEAALATPGARPGWAGRAGLADQAGLPEKPGQRPRSARVRALEVGPLAGAQIVPGGAYLLTLGEHGATLWDVASGARRLELGPARVAASFPSGNELLLAHGAEVRRVSIPSGKHRWQATASGEVRALAIRPDGGRVAAATGDGLIELRESQRGRRTATLEGHPGRVTGLAFSPDGLRLASGASDGLVRLWSTERGTVDAKIHVARGWQGEAQLDVSFAPDGRALLVVALHEEVSVWELPSLERRASLPLGYHDRAAFDAPSGRLALLTTGPSARDDDLLELRGIDGARLARLALPKPNHAEALALLSPGTSVVVLDRAGHGAIYDLGRGVDREPTPARAHEGAIDAISVSARGDRVVTVGRRSEATGGQIDVRVWDGDGGEAVADVGGGSVSVDDVLLSADGSLALTWSRLDSGLSVWGLRRGVRKHTRLLGHADQVLDAALHPDGQRVVSASRDGTLRLWDMGSRKPLLTMGNSQGSIERVALHPDGLRLAEAGQGGREEGEVRLWDLRSGEPLGSVYLYAERARALAFSAGGVLLAGSGDGHLVAFNVDDGSCVVELDAHPAEPVTWVGFAGRSSVPMSSTALELAIWDVTTGQARLRVPLGGKAFRVDPTGRVLALFGSPSIHSRSLELVDLQTGAPLAAWQTDAPVVSASFGPGGLVAAGDDRGNLYLLKLLPDGTDTTLLDAPVAPVASTTRKRREAQAPRRARTGPGRALPHLGRLGPEELQLPGPHPLDGQHPQLRARPAPRREAPRLAPRRQHAVARHDDRKRVAAQRMPHGARGASGTNARRHLAVRERRPRRYRPGHLVDLPLEGADPPPVERDRTQVDGLPSEQRHDRCDRLLHGRRRRLRGCPGKPREDPRPRLRLVPFGKLNAGDAPVSPDEPTHAEHRVEQGKFEHLHRRSPLARTTLT
jgi:WD40 repeat protein